MLHVKRGREREKERKEGEEGKVRGLEEDRTQSRSIQEVDEGSAEEKRKKTRGKKK